MKTYMDRSAATAVLMGIVVCAGAAVAGTALAGSRPESNSTALAVNAYGGAGLIMPQDPTGAPSVNASARTGSATAEVLVLTTATAVPATGLTGRRAIEIQNLGPNTIYCRCDGVAPVVKKARGIDPSMSWAINCSEVACACQCIAATANQVTTAATIVTETK